MCELGHRNLRSRIHPADTRHRVSPLLSFKRVNHRFQVPLNALVLQSVVPAILGLIYLGSQTIFFAFFQLTTIGYLVSYFIPILLVFLRRDLLPPAYWRMPTALAKFCNIVSLLYVSLPYAITSR